MKKKPDSLHLYLYFVPDLQGMLNGFIFLIFFFFMCNGFTWDEDGNGGDGNGIGMYEKKNRSKKLKKNGLQGKKNELCNTSHRIKWD